MDTKPKIDIQALAKEIIAFLPGWKVRNPLHEETMDTHVAIAREDGPEIVISGNGWRRDGRLHIGASTWPKSKKGEQFSPYRHGRSGEKSPDISVAAGRSPKDIAREIERRLIPDYITLYMELAARRDATDIRQDIAKEKCAELTKIVKGETRGLEAGDGEVHWYHEDATYGDAKSHDGGKEWTLNVHNLSFEKIVKILKIVKE